MIKTRISLISLSSFLAVEKRSKNNGKSPSFSKISQCISVPLDTPLIILRHPSNSSLPSEKPLLELLPQPIRIYVAFETNPLPITIEIDAYISFIELFMCGSSSLKYRDNSMQPSLQNSDEHDPINSHTSTRTFC